MEPNQDDHFLARSFTYFQKIVRQSGSAASASYTLLGSIILLGAIGYILDSVYNWTPYGLLGGLFLGLIVGFYELVKTIWKS